MIPARAARSFDVWCPKSIGCWGTISAGKGSSWAMSSSADQAYFPLSDPGKSVDSHLDLSQSWETNLGTDMLKIRPPSPDSHQEGKGSRQHPRLKQILILGFKARWLVRLWHRKGGVRKESSSADYTNANNAGNATTCRLVARTRLLYMKWLV